MGDSKSRGEWLALALARHLRGWFVSTQTTLMVGCHFGWVMLLLIGLSQGGGSGGGLRALGQGLLRAYVWLGGVDASGRGGVPELMEVWGKLSLALYALQWGVGRVRPPRPPWSFWRQVALSTGIAAAGYGVAFVAIAPRTQNAEDGGPVLLGLVLFTFFASAWALSVQRGFAAAEKAFASKPPSEALPPGWTAPGAPAAPEAAPEPPRGLRARYSLGWGLGVLAVGVLVGPELPRRYSAPEEEALRTVSAQDQANFLAWSRAQGECRGVAACEARCADDEAAACVRLSGFVEQGQGGARQDAERARALMAKACALGDETSCLNSEAGPAQHSLNAE